MKRLNITLPDQDYEFLSKLKKEGKYTSFSSAVSFSLKNLRKEMLSERTE